MYLFLLFTWALAVEAPLDISKDGTICYGLLDTSYAGPLVIPEGVKIIWTGAFYNNPKLTSLELPQSLKEIQEQAFLWCTGLTGSLVIPDSVTIIGLHAFVGCRGLTEVHVGRQTTRIPSYVFQGCSLLKRCFFYNSKVTIQSSAFSQCPELHIFYEINECKDFTIDTNAFDESPTMASNFVCLASPIPPPTSLFTKVMVTQTSIFKTLQLAFVLFSL